MSRRLVVLGSTGSIGRQGLAVADRWRDRLTVSGLAAGRDLDGLEERASAIRPEGVALEHADDPSAARARLERAVPGARVWVGRGAAASLVRETPADVVLNGIVGAAGLEASLATLERGARLALANKETLVVGAALVHEALRAGGELLPVDSEHSAALQCLGNRPPEQVARLVLTASGGALRDHPDWRHARREEVLAHPVWSMGSRITVDSALMVNKGLEMIEAHALFGLDWGQLEAVLHPEARVHAWATFVDGSTLLQAAAPDMQLPIQLAISWPDRWPGALEPLDASDLAGLTFAPIPVSQYPAFAITVSAGRRGGTAPCVLNAADEIAVQAFLEGALELGRVPEVLSRVLDAHTPEPVESLEQLREWDAWARERARDAVMMREVRS